MTPITGSLNKYLRTRVEEIVSPQLVSQPLVSVCVFAFNHESTIRQAINSVLAQQTDFTVEIILGEDQSKDGTRNICREYAENHPSRIRLLLHSRDNNIAVNNRPTAKFNVFYCMYRSRGRYLAFLDGDDYWTDPLKLQKQVNELETNKDFVLCAHPVLTVDQVGRALEKQKGTMTARHVLSRDDIAEKGCLINTGSVVFRNVPGTKDLPQWFYNLSTGDFGLFLFLTQFGNIVVLPEVMGAYRVHGGGLWSTRSELQMYSDIAHNIGILYSLDFPNGTRERLLLQNRNNFRHLLLDALHRGDYTTIEKITEVSLGFDTGFGTFFLKEILQPHMKLMQSSGAWKLARKISGALDIFKRRRK